MEPTALMAFALIGFDSPESQSALPNAPVVDDRAKDRGRRLMQARGRLASGLHRLAWAIEPNSWSTPKNH